MDYLSLCLICKDENDYLAEWLDYHILMGVERFYIYDNDSQISLRTTLQDYIQRGWVVVTDIAGKAMQLHAYDHCLRVYGTQTTWLGFVDTDEFLVSKTTLDLREFLRAYEDYAGLAVGSLFFGSGGQKERPLEGQIAGYQWRTDETHPENKLIKSIVRPAQVLIPSSPHDFVYKENVWCVNEDFKRVDYQSFPNSFKKIQLNHYYCRSESEIEKKLQRGRGDAGAAWKRHRFEAINLLSTVHDSSIVDNLNRLFQAAGLPLVAPGSRNILAGMAHLAGRRRAGSIIPVAEQVAEPQPQLAEMMRIKDWMSDAQLSTDPAELQRLLNSAEIQTLPQTVAFFISLMGIYLTLNQPAYAWQAVAKAWKMAPNSVYVLQGMAYYFLQVKNFEMLEKTARLVLELTPHNLWAIYLLTEAMLGFGRYEEALKIGMPVIEVSARLGELPEKTELFLIKRMADYLVQKKDYAVAVHLWEMGVLMHKDLETLVELAQILALKGDRAALRQRLDEIAALDPQHPVLLKLAQQLPSAPGLS